MQPHALYRSRIVYRTTSYIPELTAVTGILASAHLSRRRFVALSLSLLASTALPQNSFAQAAVTPPVGQPPSNAPIPFSYDILSEMMKAKAKTDFVPGEIKLPQFIAALDY